MHLSFGNKVSSKDWSHIQIKNISTHRYPGPLVWKNPISACMEFRNLSQNWRAHKQKWTITAPPLRKPFPTFIWGSLAMLDNCLIEAYKLQSWNLIWHGKYFPYSPYFQRSLLKARSQTVFLPVLNTEWNAALVFLQKQFYK